MEHPVNRRHQARVAPRAPLQMQKVDRHRDLLATINYIPPPDERPRGWVSLPR